MTLQNVHSGRLNLLQHASGPHPFTSSSDMAMTSTTAGLRLNYNPPVAPPVDYQPPYFPPPYSIPQASEFQHQHQHGPPCPPPHHFDPYRVYQHQQPHQLMSQPPINGYRHHPHHQQPGYYHQPDRYLLGDAIHRGGFVVPPGHELSHGDGMEYVCIGGQQPVVATHNDPVSPTYKAVDADRALTTSSCLRLIGVDNDDRDQVTPSQCSCVRYWLLAMCCVFWDTTESYTHTQMIH